MTREANTELRAVKTRKNLRRMRGPLALLLAVAIFTAAFLLKPTLFIGQEQTNNAKGFDKSETPAIPVVAATVSRGDFPVYLSGLGTVTALKTVTVRTRVDGELIRVAFQEGQMVKAGDVLAEIDPRPFKTQLMQSQGQLMRDEALLKNAEIDLARYRTLLTQDSIAGQQVATQEALVKQYHGAVATDRGQIANAELQLDYARIVSPLSGRVGLRLVDQGNIVHASDSNGLAVITQVQPIAVIYTLPEDNLPAVMQRLRSGEDISLEAYNRAGNIKLAEGKLLAVDNQIDPATGTVKLKGQFANDDQVLFPNQFVNIRMLVDTLRSVVIIPSAAVQRGAPGAYVYVVNPDATVSVRVLQLGPSDGEKVAVLDGLNPDERIVVDGVDKLQEGAKVELAAGNVKHLQNGGGQ